jgi:hypothetical protein
MLELLLESAGAGVGLGAVTLTTVRRHNRGRYARSLRDISELERELGIVGAEEPSRTYAEPYVQIVRSPYVCHSCPPPAPPASPVVGYQGPDLTDEDVRRLEHPSEFRKERRKKPR